MGLLQCWITALVVVALLLMLRYQCRRHRLPVPPLRLPALAALAWAVLRSFSLELLPEPNRLWVGMLDDLLIAYAAVMMLVWATLELPGGLGWGRQSPELLRQLVSLGGWGLATVVVVRQNTRLDLVGLVTTSAVATAMIGLAGQEALKDLFAGLELQLGDDFAVGDWLEVEDGVDGIVVSVSWRDTSLRNVDDILLVVPNSRITQVVQRNRGAYGHACTRFTVGLDYAYPPARAREVITRIVRQHRRALEEPAPTVRLMQFQESAIAYEVQVWQKEIGRKAMLDLRNDLLEQIWYALRREGQTIPYPVRELRPHEPPPPPETHALPSMEECCQALATDRLLTVLDGHQLRQLSESSRLMAYGPGEAIVVEGAEGTSMYHLLRGRVEVLKQVSPAHSVPVAELGPGDVFGEMTLFLNAPRSATVRAQGECLLVRVDRDSIRELLEANPALLERFAALVSERQAKLESIGREHRADHTNALLESMKRLFFAFTGS